MPRIKASPKKCVKSQQASNTWLFLMKGEGLEFPEGCSSTPDMVKLRHPQTGSQAMFLFSADEGMVQEVLSFSENKRSWVIDECVKSDGKMHLSTPVDPVFLVLPYLYKSAGRYEPFEQLLRDEDFPETARLLRTVSSKQLGQIADCKGEDGEEPLLRYNEEKTLAWLGRKVRRVAEALQQKGLHVGAGAVSANFVRGSRPGEAASTTPDLEEFLQYAHGIVAEYVPTELSNKLRKNLGLPEEQSGGAEGAAKRKLGTGSAHNVAAQEASGAKKPRTEETGDDVAGGAGRNNGILDLTKPEKVMSKREAAKDKARAKAAAGTKSITSFFKKK
ncbi:hypothetical protein B566_EDAN000628 [Ephemera danica]|nr:hypothetical protein B566_EDAN000628 [Ephemera danica]